MTGNNYFDGFVSYKNAIHFYEALGELSEIPKVSNMSGGLYHYTSTTVLNAILSSGTFRASNLFYLNDEIEYKRGIDILKKVFSKDELILKYISEIENFDGKSWAGVYSISYSNQPDVLQQWITYAKESGVCIELNGDIVWNQSSDELYLGIKTQGKATIRIKNKCFLNLAYENNIENQDNDLGQLDPNKIRLAFAESILKADKDDGYDITIEEGEFSKIWSEHEDKAKQFLQLLASYFKEERFKGEGEIRAAFLPIYKSETTKTKISYFEQGNGILRPYIDVCYLHKYNSIKNTFSVECPIKTILVGPSGNQQKVYNSIVHRLKYGEVKCWKYTNEQLGDILSKYIEGCTNSCNIEKDSDYLSIVDLLASDWCKRNSLFYHIEKATKASVVVKVMIEGKEKKNNDSESAKCIALKYMENNYLSSQGIWVKKSSLPYNF